MIPLFPPITTGGLGLFDVEVRPERRIIALQHGPRYVRGRYSRVNRPHRWHRLRSAMRFADDHVSFHTWCGQSMQSRRSVGRDNEPADFPVCGTCEGRALGAGHDIDPAGRDLIFLPWRLEPPLVCPTRDLYVQVEGSVGRCLLCGTLETIRYGSRGYDWRVFLAAHAPGPNLVPGCPLHAWRAMTMTNSPDGRATCVCDPDRIQARAWAA